MASAMISSALASKFKGCMIGALVGDCLGGPFEGDSPVSKRVLTNYLSNLLSGGSIQIFPYTDDTAMTISVAKSLIENEKLDSKDMAKKFVSKFYKQPHRGYGVNVIDVFRALKETDFEDVFLPAKLQFNGIGSYGNGAAMRIAPLALFGHKKGEEYIKKTVAECSHITHTHHNGYNGAILQCLAINTALGLDATKELDPVHFINYLQNIMENIEMKEDKKEYTESLNKIKEIYLQKQEDISSEEIAEYLGNNVSAHRSVPTAIYSFLRGLKPFPGYEGSTSPKKVNKCCFSYTCSNPFVRTIYFAISVGGDTDTIASMAGSIAGAYHGAELIPETLQKRCERIEKIIELADKLFHIAEKEA